MNKVHLIGRNTKDIELKRTQNGKFFCNFTVACDRRFKNADGNRETDFINCVAWNQTAEFIAKYFRKGSRIAVVGSIQVRTSEENGAKRYFTEVIVEEAEFVESNKSQSTQTQSAPAQTTAEPSGDLPFEL